VKVGIKISYLIINPILWLDLTWIRQKTKVNSSTPVELQSGSHGMRRLVTISHVTQDWLHIQH